MAVCAILCGADNWAEVADWCKDRKAWLRERFGWSLEHGTPSHDTFGTLSGAGRECFRGAISGLDQ
ncbi:MAG: transposase family protein [Candidatus Accumulibacter sp.]|nr:transposase family protein [Accumulibacter sp.]